MGARLGSSLQNARRRLFRAGDLWSLLLVLALLTFPALALDAAQWPLDLAVILPAALLSVVIGFVLARSDYNELLALILAGAYGAFSVILLAGLNEPGGVRAVIDRMLQWLSDAFGGGINQDPIAFTLLVGMLFWMLGFNAAWHVFRIDRVWRVILPPAIILLTNAVFYNGTNSLEPSMIGFMFVALMLVAHSSLDEREWDWYSHGIRVPRRLRGQFLRVGAVLAAVAVITAWIIPTNSLQQQLDNFQEFMRSDPLRDLNEVWSRLFQSVEAEGPTSADYYGSDSLNLTGAIRLGDQEVLIVQAPTDRRYYWRSRVFDTYELGQWSSGASIRLTTPQSPLSIVLEADRAREAVEQLHTVAMRSTRLVYGAPQLQSVDLATRTYLSYIYQNVDASPMNVSAVRPIQPLVRGEQYTVTSLMSIATADELRAAGTAYPDWIINHPQYLRASPNVIGERTRALAQQIVDEAAASTPYDKAKALERWLRQNIAYNETIPTPPAGLDPIEWFLFDIQEGYCNYYATAMITMLRAQGIPSRMAAGFAQGTYDAARGEFIVRERDAHTWVEAYFPGYGWIEFEPTSAQSPLTRDGDQSLPEDAQFQPLEATATFTPTPTIPPSATPSPTLDASQPTPTPDPQEVQSTPTITPTPTPSPTPTPVIVPTRPAPLTPPPRDPLAFILPALGTFLLIVLVVMLLLAIAVFLYWWWEWRGLRGMSPISRAYSRLERYARLIGIRFAGQETPEERRRKVAQNLPQAERPVTAITRLYTSERYGPQRSADDIERREETANAAWGETRGRILRRWLRRLRFWQRD